MKVKTMVKGGLLAAALLMFLAGGAWGQQGSMPGHSMGVEAKYPGQMIRMSHLEGGWMPTYQLLGMKERNELMKGMEGMEMPGMSSSPDITNHLMVFIQGPDGKLASGRVGFQLIGPDGKEQKTLTMGMFGGYGADVSLKAKGNYKIKMKAVIGDKTANDEFIYERK